LICITSELSVSVLEFSPGINTAEYISFIE